MRRHEQSTINKNTARLENNSSRHRQSSGYTTKKRYFFFIADCYCCLLGHIAVLLGTATFKFIRALAHIHRYTDTHRRCHRHQCAVNCSRSDWHFLSAPAPAHTQFCVQTDFITNPKSIANPSKVLSVSCVFFFFAFWLLSVDCSERIFI